MFHACLRKMCVSLLLDGMLSVCLLGSCDLCVCVCVCVCVCARICLVVSDSAAPYTVAHKASLPIEFSRQEYWSQLPFPSPDRSDPWSKFACLTSPALEGCFFTTSITWEAHSLGQIDYFFIDSLSG